MLNKRISSWVCILIATAISISVAGSTETIEKKKLKIFILAGQSNMVGAASIATFDYIGDDPKTVEMLNEMRALVRPCLPALSSGLSPTLTEQLHRMVVKFLG